MTDVLDWSLTPYLTVGDAAAAIDFYKRAFGAREVMRVPTDDGRRLMHAALDLHGAGVFLADDFSEGGHDPKALGGSPVTLHLSVPDVDATVDQAVKAGAEVTMPVADMFWGERYGRIRDPFGHEWSLSTPSRREGSRDLPQSAPTKPKG